MGPTRRETHRSIAIPRGTGKTIGRSGIEETGSLRGIIKRQSLDRRDRAPNPRGGRSGNAAKNGKKRSNAGIHRRFHGRKKGVEKTQRDGNCRRKPSNRRVFKGENGQGERGGREEENVEGGRRKGR